MVFFSGLSRAVQSDGSNQTVWATAALRKAGAALPAEVTRAQWLMFGHGATRGAKAVVADQIWGAALGAINGLTYGLVKDGVEFMPVAATVGVDRKDPARRAE